jgi:hypothetical protein
VLQRRQKSAEGVAGIKKVTTIVYLPCSGYTTSSPELLNLYCGLRPEGTIGTKTALEPVILSSYPCTPEGGLLRSERPAYRYQGQSKGKFRPGTVFCKTEGMWQQQGLLGSLFFFLWRKSILQTPWQR